MPSFDVPKRLHAAQHATGQPDAITPAAIGAATATHTHVAGNVTSGTFTPARLGTGTASASTVLYGDGAWKAAPTAPVSSVNGKTGAVTLGAADVGALPSSYTPPAQSWSQITGKPSTFPPSAHTHAAGEITGLPGPQTLSLTGSDLALSGGGGTVTLPSGGGSGAAMGGMVPFLEVTHTVSLAPLGSSKSATARPVGAVPSRMDLMPVTLGYNVTVDRLAVNISTAGAGDQGRFAIYSSNEVGHPDALVWDSGNVPTDTAGVKTFTQTVTLPKGVLWLCAALSGPTPSYSGWQAQDHTATQGNAQWPPLFYQPRGFTARLDGPNFITGGFPTSIASYGMTRDHDGWSGAPVIIVHITEVAP